MNVIHNTEDRTKELTKTQRSIDEDRDRHNHLDQRLEAIEAELSDRRERKADLTDEREVLEADLEELETTVDDLENEEFSEILAKHREANEIEFDIGRLQEDLDEVAEDIEIIERRRSELDDLGAEREATKEALVDARTRIDQIEEQAIQQFNTHIETVLELLEYRNLERIWIERVEREIRDGRRKIQQTQFELHIIRTTDTGTTCEDTVDHLSESAREVTGLVFALAGCLVHDVYEILPFLILDSMEALDSDRIAHLVEYFSDFAEYSIVALRPEDEQALDDSYRRLSDI